ncbi:MAG: outer membrane lipoprotein-sorting protein [Desulfobacteraceae bacterium]|nr:MAG: outer membrane lipoprotein-sorting protein [Desulfobacteraceae bacterium]
MKGKQLTIPLTIILSILWIYPVWCDDARSIMQQVLDRNDGTTEISRVRLSSCTMAKSGGKLKCTETPRVKVMDMVRKDYGPREKDHKTVTIILEPAGEKGIGFLQYDYEQKGKDTDQWLYLSALGKVKRIVSGNEDEPKTGSFFGTEFSYEDMESIHLEDYTYKILGSEVYQNSDCWVVESIPVMSRARKSNYSKVMDWVDKKRFIVLKSVLFNRQGKKFKKIYYRKIDTIDDILVPRQIIVFNIQTRRRTVLSYENIRLNRPVQDDFLTQRTLTDGAFREMNLKGYQQNLVD